MVGCRTALAVGLVLVALGVTAEPVADRVRRSVERWSSAGSRLGLPRNRHVREVVRHAVGLAAFHEARFEEGGFAVVDASGSVVAFADRGIVEERAESPLWALLKRRQERAPLAATVVKAGAARPSVSDLRVEPLVASHWNQADVGDRYCYNYYTPNHYFCGCVATAMAQVMRYHEWPSNPLTVETNDCFVQGAVRSLTMLGGPYDWSAMPDDPESGATESEREAIGRVTYDAGVAMHMEYSSEGSGAVSGAIHLRLREVFGYRSAECVVADEGGDSLEDGVMRQAILASLDARAPVMLGIYRWEAGEADNGHCIVADGYGFADGVCYVHLNMGWGGVDDAWYALPDIGTDYGFNTVDSAVYNVFPRADGAVVSGHVTTNGVSAADVRVSVWRTDGSWVTNLVSDAQGVYAAVLAEMASYRLVASAGNQTLTNVVATGYSSSFTEFDWSNLVASWSPIRGLGCGNRWGNDFAFGSEQPEAPRQTIYVSASDGSDTDGAGTDVAPFASISAALARAGDGDTVLVAPGVYTGLVQAASSTVTIRSTEGPDVTVIDAAGTGPCYYGFDNTNTVLCGFTLRNGWWPYGAGVCGGTVSNCVIRDCAAYYYDSRNPGCGGGAYGARLVDTYVFGNMAKSYGGGVAACDLVRCTVVGNRSETGSGADADSSCRDSIVWDNANFSGEQDDWESFQGTVTAFDHSCTGVLPPEGEGNTAENPLFVNEADGDLRLRAGSACLGAASDGKNMGAYQGQGVPGVRISVVTVGPGTVSPVAAVVEDGQSAVFTASDHHPFLGYETNGVVFAETQSLVLACPESDVVVTARFAHATFHVDRAGGDDGNDGWSWRTPKQSLQAAADLVVTGDRVEVAPGVYGGVITSSFGVPFVSRDGAAETVIDAQGGNCCFLDFGDTTLVGFTLRNCVVLDDNGGGAAYGTLVDCVISNCWANAGGGASDSYLRNCVVAFNRAVTQGGGAYACTLENCTVYGNRADRPRNALSALAGGGVDCQCVCTNAIVWGNVNAAGASDNWEAYVQRRTGTTVPRMVNCCTAPENTVATDNVHADPRLVAPRQGDFRLYENSPCLGTGFGGGDIGAPAGVVPLPPGLFFLLR